MSLDLFLVAKKCEHCGNGPSPIDFNITYNLSPMWEVIYPYDEEMIKIEGMTLEESLSKLEYALVILDTSPEVFLNLNPPNGYGVYEEFRLFIAKLIIACLKHPNRIWEAWR